MSGPQEDKKVTTKRDEVVEEKRQEDPTDTRQKKKVRTIRLQKTNGEIEDVAYFPAPRHHATDSVTRNAVRANEQARGKNTVKELPKAAQDDVDTEWHPVPAGGIAALADKLYYDDTDDDDKMDAHIQDIMTLNRDIIRDDTNVPSPHTMVRVFKN